MKGLIAEENIQQKIYLIRGQKVILDFDLAQLYGVTTGRLNEQIKRNLKRFPGDFMFRLKAKEHGCLISQNAISKKGRGGRRKLPLAFTEQGAIMAANVLNSASAVRMSVFVVRAFTRMRAMLVGNKKLAAELIELEKKLTGRLDVHESAIVDILKRIMELIDPPPAPPAPPAPPKRKIGFHAEKG